MPAKPVHRIVSWNTKVGRGDDAIVSALKSLIKDLNPDVICLQECKGYANAIRHEFGVNNGGQWQVMFTNDWPEAQSNPVLVHKRYGHNEHGEPDGWNTLRTHKTWTGPQGGDHQGRTWTWVKVGGIYVMSLHRATGMTKGNKDAGQEEAATIEDWMRKKGLDQRFVIIGDHNIGPKKDSPAWSSKQIALNVGGSVRFDKDDPGIDYAITRNVKAQNVARKQKYGSDHRAVVFVVEQ